MPAGKLRASSVRKTRRDSPTVGPNPPWDGTTLRNTGSAEPSGTAVVADQFRGDPDQFWMAADQLTAVNGPVRANDLTSVDVWISRLNGGSYNATIVVSAPSVRLIDA